HTPLPITAHTHTPDHHGSHTPLTITAHTHTPNHHDSHPPLPPPTTHLHTPTPPHTHAHTNTHTSTSSTHPSSFQLIAHFLMLMARRLVSSSVSPAVSWPLGLWAGSNGL